MRLPSAFMALLYSHSLAFGEPTSVPSLERARQLYRTFEYEQCLRALDNGTLEAKVATDQAQVEIYKGLCALGLSKRAEAVDHFRAAVALDPAADVPPLTSPKIRQLFDTAVEGRRAAPVVQQTLPPPESQPTTVIATSPATASSESRPSRALPLSLGGVAVVATAGYAFFGLRARAAEEDAGTALYQDDLLAASDRARDNALFANISVSVAVTSGASAILYMLLTRD